MNVVVPALLLIVGVAVIGIGCANWRSGGWRLALAGAINVAFAASVLLQSRGDGLQYTAWAVLAVLLATAFLTVRRATWRVARLELVLAGSTVLAILTSQLLLDVLPFGVRLALLVLVGVLGTSFIAVTLVRTTRMLRSAARTPRVR